MTSLGNGKYILNKHVQNKVVEMTQCPLCLRKVDWNGHVGQADRGTCRSNYSEYTIRYVHNLNTLTKLNVQFIEI